MSIKYVSLESPDNSLTVDFLGEGHDDKPRVCTVTLTVENGKLTVCAKGCDDHATILIDTVVDIPEEDFEDEGEGEDDPAE